MPLYELRLRESYDDSYTAGPEGPYSYTTIYLRWSGYVNPPTTWLSFPSDIPRAASILQARLVVVPRTATGQTNALIRAITWWTDLRTQPSGVQIAQATVVMPASEPYRPLELDVTSLVQAVVNHPDYTKPGRICLRIRGGEGPFTEREICAWDAQDGYEAVLYVSVASAQDDTLLDDADEEEDPMNLVVLEPLTADGNDQPVQVPRGNRLLVRATTADVEIRHVPGGTAKFTVTAGNTLRWGQSLGQVVYLRATAGTVIELALT